MQLISFSYHSALCLQIGFIDCKLLRFGIALVTRAPTDWFHKNVNRNSSFLPFLDLFYPIKIFWQTIMEFSLESLCSYACKLPQLAFPPLTYISLLSYCLIGAIVGPSMLLLFSSIVILDMYVCMYIAHVLYLEANRWTF